MHPYKSLDDKSFWSPAVAKRNMFDISDLWVPSFPINPRHKVVTFGSCFAQHIGKSLHSRGFDYYVAEKSPLGLSEENSKKYNYGTFSARTGNIYTATLLKQWVCWALGDEPVPNEIWEQDGRYYDPFRPNIEPNGFSSALELETSREDALAAFKKCLLYSDVFVFTMGLTESWFNSDSNVEYPMCPGTVAGEYDDNIHQFVNQDYVQIYQTMLWVLKRIRKVNEKIQFLLTVSPVPLTATNSGNHVLLASMESKSILRAVAGKLQRQLKFVDYFPSFEIISSTPYRGVFFESNLRAVNKSGVEHVMNMFFSALSGSAVRRVNKNTRDSKKINQSATSGDVVCEEELLNAFSS